MKKVLAILALAVFIGGISAPVIASSNNAPSISILADEEPKKDEKSKKAKKADKKADAKKSSDCTSAKKSDCCPKEAAKDCKK